VIVVDDLLLLEVLAGVATSSVRGGFRRRGATDLTDEVRR